MSHSGRHFPDDNPYTKVPNYLLQDRQLDLKTKGLACVIQSLPPTWDFSVCGLASICNCGEDTIRSALKLLERCGYLTRRQVRGKRGAFQDVVYQFMRPEPIPDYPTSVDPGSGLGAQVITYTCTSRQTQAEEHTTRGTDNPSTAYKIKQKAKNDKKVKPPKRKLIETRINDYGEEVNIYVYD